MDLEGFQVTNYRNVRDSGWIDVARITAFVGQNEAGKSNLFEALYRINPYVPAECYNIDEDWPVDDWGNKDPSALVCTARFSLTQPEIDNLYAAAGTSPTPPATLSLVASRWYDHGPVFSAPEPHAAELDAARVDEWAKSRAPKFVYIQDHQLSGAQIELDALAERLAKTEWNDLTIDEQTIKVILDLAKIDIGDFMSKGATAQGRTVRTFDKRAASAYLSQQFRELWTQKQVSFDIEIDGTTLNIFAEDDAVGMPVRLHRRSSGFRWHAGFAWKFTHASKGRYKECILLLEEPGIHLHYAGQRDLLETFERLAPSNTILYTTHLASMIDLANPERVRIVETKDKNHAFVRKGVVSAQRIPMAVIETALGLTGDMSGLLETRHTLIVEGGDDALILHKLSVIMRSAGRPHLSDRVHLWPTRGALHAPMYAAFAVGRRWASAVLLDSDAEGHAASAKIQDLALEGLAAEQKSSFRTLMLGQTAGISQADAAIEDLFDPPFYLDCVNAALGLSVKEADLPADGSTSIARRVATHLGDRHGRELDKRRVMAEILRRFDTWSKITDLPRGTGDKAARVFTAVEKAFSGPADRP